MNNKYRRRLFQMGSLYHIFRDQGFSGFVKPHSHTFYQYTVIEKGRITQMHDGMQNSQFRGDAFFTPPGCEHSLFVFDNDTVYYTVSFSKRLFEDAASAVPDLPANIYGQSLFFQMEKGEYDLLLKNLEILMNWPEHNQTDLYTSGCHICAASVILLLNAIKNIHSEPEQVLHNLRDPEQSILRVMHYIDEHYYEMIHNQNLIAMTPFAKTTFFANFQRVAGVTPKQYITEKRMHEALRLIRDTDMHFHQIAEEVGYNDFSTFFRNFYRMSSQSPSEYRIRERNGTSLEEN